MFFSRCGDPVRTPGNIKHEPQLKYINCAASWWENSSRSSLFLYSATRLQKQKQKKLHKIFGEKGEEEKQNFRANPPFCDCKSVIFVNIKMEMTP